MQHRERAAGVIEIVMRQYQSVEAVDALMPQRRRNHAYAGILAGGIARSGVDQQRMARGAHQHRFTLADIAAMARGQQEWPDSVG